VLGAGETYRGGFPGRRGCRGHTRSRAGARASSCMQEAHRTNLIADRHSRHSPRLHDCGPRSHAAPSGRFIEERGWRAVMVASSRRVEAMMASVLTYLGRRRDHEPRRPVDLAPLITPARRGGTLLGTRQTTSAPDHASATVIARRDQSRASPIDRQRDRPTAAEGSGKSLAPRERPPFWMRADGGPGTEADLERCSNRYCRSRHRVIHNSGGVCRFSGRNRRRAVGFLARGRSVTLCNRPEGGLAPRSCYPR